MARDAAKQLIIGVGNDQRGDDGAGLYAARLLRAKRLPDTAVIESGGDIVSIVESWKGFDTVCLIDAVASGGRPGSVRRYDALMRVPVEANLRCSTHAFGLRETIELARALDQLPRRLLLYGIAGVNFALGEPISAAVMAGARKAVAAIVRDLGARPGGR